MTSVGFRVRPIYFGLELELAAQRLEQLSDICNLTHTLVKYRILFEDLEDVIGEDPEPMNINLQESTTLGHLDNELAEFKRNNFKSGPTSRLRSS